MASIPLKKASVLICFIIFIQLKTNTTAKAYELSPIDRHEIETSILPLLTGHGPVGGYRRSAPRHRQRKIGGLEPLYIALNLKNGQRKKIWMKSFQDYTILNNKLIIPISKEQHDMISNIRNRNNRNRQHERNRDRSNQLTETVFRPEAFSAGFLTRTKENMPIIDPIHNPNKFGPSTPYAPHFNVNSNSHVGSSQPYDSHYLGNNNRRYMVVDDDRQSVININQKPTHDYDSMSSKYDKFG